MSQAVTIAGAGYTIPDVTETGWGQNVTDWCVAVSTSLLQTTGGSFVLSAEVDFGASFGLQSIYLKSRDSAPAAAGVLRLGNGEIIAWRNNADGADLDLLVNASDQLTYEAVDLQPLTTQGDVIYRDGSTQNVRLAIGTQDQVLAVSSGGIPEWQNAGNTVQFLAGQTSNFSSGTPRYMDYPMSGSNVEMSVTRGYCMGRAGSIVGISAYVDTDSATSGVVTATAQINGVDAFATSTDPLTGDVDAYPFATQAAGIDTFSAGDFISLHGLVASGAANVTVIVISVEVKFDT